MKQTIVEIVEGTDCQEERLSSGWRLLSCRDVKEGGCGWLREEVKSLFNNPREAGPVGTEYKLKDGKMYGKTFHNHNYDVIEGNFDDEMTYALMVKHRPLCITILRAKDLMKMDTFGSSDPYVVINVVNRSSCQLDFSKMTDQGRHRAIRVQKKTTVKKRTLNPEWNEEFNIYIDKPEEVLVLDVFDWNLLRSHKFLGRAVIDLNYRIESPQGFRLKKIRGSQAWDVWLDKNSILFIDLYFPEITGDLNDTSETLSNINIDSTTNPVLNSLLGEPGTSAQLFVEAEPSIDANSEEPLPVLNSLPEDWEERIDKNGRTFYVNHSTNSTQWERPIIGPVTLESHSSQDGRFQMRRLISEDPTLDQHETEDEQEYLDDVSSLLPSAPPEEEAIDLGSQNENTVSQRDLVELPLDSHSSQDGRFQMRRPVSEDHTVDQPVSEDEQHYSDGVSSDMPSAAPLEEEEVIDFSSQNENNDEEDQTQSQPFFNEDTYRESDSDWESCSDSSKNPIEENSELPAGWTQGLALDGRVFFINHVERRTSWTDPRTGIPSDKSDLGPLPPGWEEKQTSDGRSFFINHATRITSWEDPRKALQMGASKIIPYSRDYKEKYEAFMNRQLSNAANLITTSDKLVLKVHRDSVFLDSFEEIKNIPPSRIDQLKARLWVEFEGETGLDYGGLAREWFSLISQSMFNPYYGLFEYSANDNYTLQINPNSGVCDENHLEHFKFIGRVAGMAVFHRKLLDGFFIRPFYKMMLRKHITLADMEAVDAEYYQSLQWIRDNDPSGLCMTFSVDEQNFGETVEKDLIPDGSEIDVTEENKHEYIEKIIEWRFDSRIQEQMDHFMAGFNDVILLDTIQIFDEGELELLLSGIGSIDVNDWRENTAYAGYDSSDIVIQWFWKVVSSFGNEMRSRLLQFVTGTSRVPMNGFKELYGSSGPQLFTIEKWGMPESLPRAHTCFNRIDLPPYRKFSDLKEKLMMAVEGSAGFEGVD